MKDEDQHIENKQSWQDDHLKGICGFANAGGGVLRIGLDDLGNVVGLIKIDRLLEDIPGKVRHHLGLHVGVNRNEKQGMPYIEVIIQPSSVAISLRGRYYYRSGSTTTELQGASLNEFLLEKSGKTWDAVLEQTASWDDIDTETVTHFRKRASQSGRMPDDETDSMIDLFEKLRLTDNGMLKRAAIVLFGKDPGRFFPNIQIKVGRFGKNESDLQFHSVEEGNIFKVLPEVGNVLNTKFLNRKVDFEGFYRIEKGEYPMAAIREMILNALVHRNYLGSFCQLRVYDDRISIWNDGGLPEGITIESLFRKHASKPRNPIIADVCFKGGLIDAWGRGTLKIIDACMEAGLPRPLITEIDGGVMVTLLKDKYNNELLNSYNLNERQRKAINYIREHPFITNNIYQNLVNTSDRTALRDLDDLVNKGLLTKTGVKRGIKYIRVGG